ncbi:MAG TPA: hypothetical protein VHY79_14565 [Rhizomicrobium sp.]|nr:hypothetical protein [Rhizomicrobium sp.]
MLSATWTWIESNGLALLIAIYFGNLACTILLALYTRTLSRRARHLTAALGRQAILLEELRKNTASLEPLRIPEAAGCAREAGERQCAGRETLEHLRSEISDRMAALPRIREEIALLQQELASDAAAEGDPLMSPRRAETEAPASPDLSVDPADERLKTLSSEIGRGS